MIVLLTCGRGTVLILLVVFCWAVGSFDEFRIGFLNIFVSMDSLTSSF